MAKPNETDKLAVGRSPISSNFACLQLELKSQLNFYIVGPKPEPESWAPITQPKFVGQAV